MMNAHWLIAPVALPLFTGALLLLLERRAPARVAPVSIAATAALLALALALAARAADGQVDAYLLGNWRAPFGIALALDRLSALMLALTAFVALASALYARAADDARGAHFHSLFQFQLMGLNGAFLTADLFNLFVFFEVLLIASYGLLLHGAGEARLKAAIHYVGFNLTASALFLIAVSMLYALAGTLNLADLAQRAPRLAAGDAALARAAALLLLVVFCAKAALAPLFLWLPDTYGAATAPVAALFALMTKVGVYAVARVYTLVFGAGGGIVSDAAQPWLPAFALVTLALAALGAVAAPKLRALVAYLVVASAGTLLLGLGLGSEKTIAAALFYLVDSTLVVAALFLLTDRIDAQRGGDALVPARFAAERNGLGAVFFVCAVAVAGLPPLAGFLGKALLLDAARAAPLGAWVWSIVLVSSFGVLVALSRAGSLVFWRPALPGAAAVAAAPTAPLQAGAIGALLGAMLAAALLADPLASYTRAAAQQLMRPRAYVDAVLGATPASRPRDSVGGDS